MESDVESKGYVRFQLAMCSAYLGDADRLFYWLNQSVDLHEQHALNMRIESFMAAYQQDPRMQALERRAGLLP